MTKGFRTNIAAACLLVGLAGCAASGSVEDPVSRIATWFDYVGAGDIQAACRSGAPDRYRFVYNAVYAEQVRTYEIAKNPVFGDALSEVRAFTAFNLAQVDLRSINTFLHGDVNREPMTAAELAQLDRDVAADADAHAAPRDTFLRSDRFYWTVGACRSGRFYFAAFPDALPGFEALRFPADLFQHDHAGVPVNRPRKLDNDAFNPGDYRLNPRTTDMGVHNFLLQVGDNGIRR